MNERSYRSVGCLVSFTHSSMVPRGSSSSSVPFGDVSAMPTFDGSARARPPSAIGEATRGEDRVAVFGLAAIVQEQHVDVVGAIADEIVLNVAGAAFGVAGALVLTVPLPRAEVSREHHAIAQAIERLAHRVPKGRLRVEEIEVVDPLVNGPVDHVDGLLARHLEEVLRAQADHAHRDAGLPERSVFQGLFSSMRQSRANASCQAHRRAGPSELRAGNAQR